LTDTPPRRKTKGKTRDYNEALDGAIPASAKLPPCEIGAIELLTFFPNHTQWPEAHLRLIRNGWKNLDIAKVSLYARSTLSFETAKKREGALRHSIRTNGKEFFDDETFKQKTHSHLLTRVTTYDATNYKPRDREQPRSLSTATLVGIAKGVTRMPTGQDRGIVTQVSTSSIHPPLNEM
jgi:hypothetical protein